MSDASRTIIWESAKNISEGRRGAGLDQLFRIDPIPLDVLAGIDVPIFLPVVEPENTVRSGEIGSSRCDP